MGNSLSDQEKKTNSLLYIESLEQAFLRPEMIEKMLKQWKEQNKPLFVTHKEFKDQVLVSMDAEVKLNYQKWL